MEANCLTMLRLPNRLRRQNAGPNTCTVAPPLRTEELHRSRRRVGVARTGLLVVVERFHNARAGAARLGLLRFVSSRPGPLAPPPPQWHGRIAQRFRAPALHAGCRGFESLFAHWCSSLLRRNEQSESASIRRGSNGRRCDHGSRTARRTATAERTTPHPAA